MIGVYSDLAHVIAYDDGESANSSASASPPDLMADGSSQPPETKEVAWFRISDLDYLQIRLAHRICINDGLTWGPKTTAHVD